MPDHTQINEKAMCHNVGDGQYVRNVSMGWVNNVKINLDTVDRVPQFKYVAKTYLNHAVPIGMGSDWALTNMEGNFHCTNFECTNFEFISCRENQFL